MTAAAGAPGRVSLMGLAFDAVTEEQTVDAILGAAAAGRGGCVVTGNLEYLRAYQRAEDVRREFDNADLVVPDGTPLLWASRIKREPLPGRVAGSDLIWSLSRAAARRGASILLVGGSPGTAEGAAERLCTEAPGLRVAGTLCPAPGFERDGATVDALVREVAAARPDIVFVGLPLAKQLALVPAVRRVLPSAWVLAVGGSFSFVSGDIRRAPAWLQRAGLEWLHRLVHEPRRLFRRYVVDGIPFACRLTAYAVLWRGLTRVATRPERFVPRRPA